MAFLAQIAAWIISDIRHIIIVVLSIILVGTISSIVILKYQIADKDSRLSELKVTNERLTLSNTNLTAQNEQLRAANTALQKYATDIMRIKKDMAAIKDKMGEITSKEDEINANNSLSDLFNNAAR